MNQKERVSPSTDQPEPSKFPTSGSSGGLSMAMRMSTDLAAALFVGGGIGYLLDYWLHTNPWFTLVFFVFGAAAGFRNVYRIAMVDSSDHVKPVTKEDCEKKPPL